MRAAAIARGRRIKRVNALTAILCGGAPAVLLYRIFPGGLRILLTGLVSGLLWANFFEYAYHRFLLHLPGTALTRRHLEHHRTVGAPDEAEHVNLGGSPIWVAVLFAVNGVPVVLVDLLLGFRVASGMLAAFAAYFIVTEELHWRIHLGEWLPPGLRGAKRHHLAHHARPDSRFSIFLPLWDWLLGTFQG